MSEVKLSERFAALLRVLTNLETPSDAHADARRAFFGLCEGNADAILAVLRLAEQPPSCAEALALERDSLAQRLSEALEWMQEVRTACKKATGGNTTFIDDDAARAIYRCMSERDSAVAKLAQAGKELDEVRAAMSAALQRVSYLTSSKLGFVEAFDACQRGLELWKDKPHNAKWWRRIDGTPIPNDLLVCIAEILQQNANADRAERDSALTQLAEARRENAWRPIESAPKGDEIFMAATADGRIMIFRGSILANMMKRSTPDHLQFPATHWRPLPSPPH